MTLANGDLTLRLSALTPYWLKTSYLTGLTFTDSAGKEFPDSFFDQHLMNAASKLEKICDIEVVEKTIRREEHDYRISDYMNWGYIQLYKVPVRRVSEVRATFPTGGTFATYPNEWTNINGETGQLFLVPSRGALGAVIIGQGGDFVSMARGGLSYMPSMWQVDYVAGMDPENIPRPIAEAIAKLAAIDVLTIVSDLVHNIGVTSESVSVDGLSQSQSYTQPAFQARIAQYTSDLYGPAGKRQELAMTSGLLKQIYDGYRPQLMSSL